MEYFCITLLVLVTLIEYCICLDKYCENSLQDEWRIDHEDCSVFHICVNGHDFRLKCPDDTVAQPDSRTCVPKGSQLDQCSNFIIPSKKSTCELQQRAKVEHSSNCAKYLDCTDSTDGEPVVKECRYPYLFNKDSGRCELFTKVDCGERAEPKNPCDYEKNQCKGPHCVPCHVRHPSCEGMNDGLNAWRGREKSPHYLICVNERVVFRGMCSGNSGETEIFHPVKKECVSLDQY